MAVNNPPDKSSQQKSHSFGFEKYFFDPHIASALGSADKAFIVEFILWSINQKASMDPDAKKDISHLYHNDRWYMYDTHDTWKERIPWLGHSTIRRYLTELIKDGWIFAAKLSPVKRDRTVYYSVNKQKYAECRSCTMENPSAQIEHMESQNDQSHLLKSSTPICPNRADDICSNRADVPLSNTHSNTPTKNPPSLVLVDKHNIDSHSKYSQEDIELADDWLAYANFEMPKLHPKSWTTEKFADDLIKLKEVLGVSHDGAKQMLDFIKDHKFWRKLCMNPNSLLKKNEDGVLKAQTILIQMRSNQDRHLTKIKTGEKTAAQIQFENMIK